MRERERAVEFREALKQSFVGRKERKEGCVCVCVCVCRGRWVSSELDGREAAPVLHVLQLELLEPDHLISHRDNQGKRKR